MTEGPHQLLIARGLTVTFPLPEGEFHAVRGVDLAIGKGETVAIVGESGSGKSMTALALMRLIPPPGRMSADALAIGETDIVRLDDRRLEDLRGRRIAMIFQDPMSSLNGVLTIGRQITEVLERHGSLRGKAASDRAAALLDMVEIANPMRILRQYPHQLSGGMRQRVMIAMALAGTPDLLVADEPTTALDVTIQAQILDLLRHLQAELGMGLLLITHDLGVVAGIADRVIVMYAGRIVEEAPAAELYDRPVHPYTKGLLATARRLGGSGGRLVPIPGQPPAPSVDVSGCSFAPRCASAVAICSMKVPVLISRGGAKAACHVFASADTVR